ncbi:hypothetical protein PCE1_000965 [Barthelona sp. PCE]
MTELAEPTEIPEIEIEKPKVPIEFDFLTTAFNYRKNNGLDYGNYKNYANFITRRIKRIRSHLKITCQPVKSKKKVPNYSPVFFDLEDLPKNVNVEDARLVELSFLCAERCWARAMIIKTSTQSHDRKSLRKIVEKCKKARKHCVHLTEVVDCHGSSTTKASCEAYCAFIQGVMLLEREDYDGALQSFTTVGNSVAMAFTDDQKLSFAYWKETVLPLQRFCRFCIQRAEGVDVMQIDLTGVSNDLIKDDIETITHAERVKKSASQDSIVWDDVELQLPIVETRAIVLEMIDAENDLVKALEQHECLGLPVKDSQLWNDEVGTYQLFNHFSVFFSKIAGARHQVSEIIRSTEDDAVMADLQRLANQLAYVQFNRTYHRCVLQANQLRYKALSEDVSPAEVVHLYEQAIQAIGDCLGVLDKKDPRARVLKVLQMFYRCYRLVYIGHVHMFAQKYDEAVVIVNQCLKQAKMLDRFMSKISISETVARDKELMVKQINVLKVRSSALLSLKQAKYDVNVPKIDQLVQFPPKPKFCLPTPLLIDLSYDCINYPDVSRNIKKKGLFKRLLKK